MRFVILDGYVDEPTCLGVPPYVSTYPRLVAGALRLAGVREQDIDYTTIDAFRRSAFHREKVLSGDVLILISGLTVPGRYLGGSPITKEEIEQMSQLPAFKVIGGPIRFGFTMRGGSFASSAPFEGYNLVSLGDVEADVFDVAKALLSGREPPVGFSKKKRTPSFADAAFLEGAFIVTKHPNFPKIICEIETYRGCERKHHCSYCTEHFYGRPEYRDLNAILAEARELYALGVRHIRIGRQPNILGYMSLDGSGDFRKPNVKAISVLFEGFDSAGSWKTLHIDNVNAGTIAAFPEQSREALSIIASFDTEGDVAAMGLESADEQVARVNNLKVSADDFLRALEIVNEVGAFKVRENGLYKLLPGINFLVGLAGESRKTFKKNRAFLEKVLDNGLLVRRVNVRQVMVFPSTALEKMVKRPKTRFRKEFKSFKEFVKKNFELPMTKRVFPVGTVLKDVLLETYDGAHTLGRQLASYPILVRIPERLKLGEFIDVAVVSHRERSVLALPVPFKINEASVKLIEHLPGVGKKKASEIVLKRPYSSLEEFRCLFPEVLKTFPLLEIP